MKIVKQTHSELILLNQPSTFTKLFLTVWSLLFAGIPLIMIGTLARDLGVTRLSCHRIEETQVRCDRQQSQLLDLVQLPAESYMQVTAASVKTERGSEWDSDRNRRVPTVDNWVVLSTSQGEVAFVEDVVRVNGTRGSVQEMQSIANDINRFLRSDDKSLVLKRDLRLRLGQSVLPLAFLSLFPFIGAVVLYCTLQSEMLVFDGTLRRLHCDRKTLLGLKTWQLPFHQIRDVAIDVHTDSDGDSTYTLALRLDRDPDKKLLSTTNRHPVETARDAIRKFLRLS
ncbi:MAG: hypothetical protein AAF978_00620 [Cyanobacteria bacterium P01_E01_bin.48]